MRIWRIIGCMILAAAAGCGAADEPYVAVYEDGRLLSGNAIFNPFGWNLGGTNNPTIGQHALVQDGHLPRHIRCRAREADLRAPYIVFNNGDILPGEAVGVLPASSAGDSGESLIIGITPPLTACRSNPQQVVVRADRIARIVRKLPCQRDPQPATLWLLDGRMAKFTAVRWEEQGLKALTEEGTTEVRYGDIKEYHAKTVDRWQAIAEDASAPCPDPASPIVRFQTVNGAALTTRRALCVEWRQDSVALRPAWSFTGMVCHKDHIVAHSFRSPSEVPLSLLDATALDERSFTGYIWRWQRDRNVRGSDLNAGSMLSELGFGVHSYTALAVDLPVDARSFSAWVGLDSHAVGGGCVRCSVYGYEMNGQPLWQSGYIRGKDGAVRVTPINIQKLKRLILVADFGHEGRPQGADPVDIRDEVDWMEPMIELASPPPKRVTPEMTAALAQLQGWEVPDDVLKKASVAPAWSSQVQQWKTAIHLPGTNQFRLTRHFTVNAAHSWLEIEAGRGRGGSGGHQVKVLVDGQPHDMVDWTHPDSGRRGRGARELKSDQLFAGHLQRRNWALGGFAGKNVTLEVVVDPVLPDVRGDPPVWLLSLLDLGPVILNAGDRPGAIEPKVPLSSLKPEKTVLPVKDATLQPGKLTDGKPLTICGYPFADGYGVPAGSELTYRLDPSWTRFVAVIGLTAEAVRVVGPFQILLDGKVLWETGNPDGFDRRTRARQIDVEIPKGHTTITLRIPMPETAKQTDYGAWAQAGFMVD